MITTRRMAAVDRNAEALGVPRKQLMESSGNAVARQVRAIAEPGSAVALVCGRGNNGGDAMVAARFLDGYDVTVHLLGRAETISTDIARENWDALGEADYETVEVTDSRTFDLGNPDVVVDAMLGTGVSGELREPESTAAGAVNDADAAVVAVDVPSGVDADTGEAAADAVEADHVVTFHDMKPGLAERDDVTVADIGIPEAAERFVGPGDLLRLDRDPDSHKGENGDILVVGGGPFTGAPSLAAEGAFRAGADLVNVACPENVREVIQGYMEDFIVRPLDGERFHPDHVEEVLSMTEDKDVVAVGPGLGDADETVEAVRQFLAEYEGKCVVDADGLRAVTDVDTDANLVCTPNAHEFERMGGETSDDLGERMDLVERFAADFGQVLLVKGRYDVVSDGKTTRAVRTGNPGMTVGGTGDVLTGVTAAFWVTQDALNAAGAASYVTGRAGDIVYEQRGDGLLATDVVERVSEAMQND